MDLRPYDLSHPGGIERWDEAMPLGNGRLGMLIYGTDEIRIALDRVDLWDKRPAPATLEPGFTYANLLRLAKNGRQEDWAEFTRLFDSVYDDTAYPSKITAGRLELSFEDAFAPSFSLSLEDGVARITDAAGALRLTAFASATEFIGVIRVRGRFSSSIHVPKYISQKETQEEFESSICNPRGMGYPPAKITKDGDFILCRQKTHTDFGYGIVAYLKHLGEWSEIYVTITASTDGEDDLHEAKQRLMRCAQTGYDALLSTHCAWWKDYWAKSSIELGDAMLEGVYYRSQYLFGSCSRKGFYPMPLQGVWTADDDTLPPWKGDYHHDTNTQLSYQAYLKANRLPEGEVFLDYLWEHRDAFAAYARDFFGVPGLLIPAVSTIDGKPMGGWAQYSMSPTMSIWTAQSFDEYFRYTGDMDFLRERAYPFLTEIGKAIDGLLEERSGKLYLPLSSSPEIHDNLRSAYLTPNSNFDLALIRYLFSTLRSYALVLSDDASAAHWEARLAKLDPIAIDDENRILLAPGEALHESHRHLSHLMCLYPLHLINFDSAENRAIYDQAILELERYGTGMWVGFSFAMAAQIYAMAGRGNGAYRHLYTFAHGFVAENGFHLNGDFKRYGYSTFHYRPFTLEASFGFCDALHEMLLQDHMGYIDVFPAIPDEWTDREIRFTDLRSRGGVLVSAVRSPQGLRQITLHSERAQVLSIRNTFSGQPVCMSSDGTHTALLEKDGMLTVLLAAGETLTISAR